MATWCLARPHWMGIYVCSGAQTGWRWVRIWCTIYDANLFVGPPIMYSKSSIVEWVIIGRWVWAWPTRLWWSVELARMVVSEPDLHSACISKRFSFYYHHTSLFNPSAASLTDCSLGFWIYLCGEESGIIVNENVVLNWIVKHADLIMKFALRDNFAPLLKS